MSFDIDLNGPPLHMQTQKIVEQLYNQCRATGHCHVLLDPQAGAPFSEQIAALDDKRAPRIHLRDPIFAAAKEQAPLLLRLPLSELALLEALALHAQQEASDPDHLLRRVCGFIQSTVSDDLLASRLSHALKLQVGRQALYFRYFDPRVALHLPDLLSADSLGQLLGGISSWAYFLWDGSFAVHEVPASNPPSPGGLQLSTAQWQRFESIEHFNATQRLFAKQGLRFEPTRTSALLAEVHAARSMGLRIPEDTAYYVACSRYASAPLPTHPAWAEVLMLLKQDVPLADALAHLCHIELPPAHPIDLVDPT